MGRAVTMLIDRELIGVFGDAAGDESPVFAQRATEELAIWEDKIVAREREVNADEERMREWDKRLRRWEEELEAREQRAGSVPRLTSRNSTARAKIGRNERCPCRSGLKYKHCHGLPAVTQPVLGGRMLADAALWRSNAASITQPGNEQRPQARVPPAP